MYKRRTIFLNINIDIQYNTITITRHRKSKVPGSTEKKTNKNENNKEKILKTGKCNVIQMTYVKMCFTSYLNLLSANCTKWSNTLKQFVGKLPANW